MDVYEFDKCLLDRLEESRDVLGFKDKPIPASQVRAEWAYYIEVQIEPTGWQALWKIPRVVCEELKIRYPTVVFGIVEQVLFKEMKAIFRVDYVEDDDIQIPEEHEVSLEELWPTIKQENTELNVERTAEIIDRLRFFYNNVWMPWDKDNDEDLDWSEKHLESRIRFFYDLKRKDMKKSLAAHVRSLLVEARYIQKRRELLELDISDDEELDETVNKNQIKDIMALHLRLARIRSEIEMFENPEIRKIYEDFEMHNGDFVKDILHTSQTRRSITRSDKPNCFIVTRTNTLEQHVALFNLAKKYIPDGALVQISPSLRNALERCKASDKIYLTPGLHSLKFLEYLNDNGLICGLCENMFSLSNKKSIEPSEAIIKSEDEDSTLMIFDGNFTIENVVLDCRNVRNGIIIKNGEITLKNCKIIGDGSSSIHEGITVSGNSKLTLDKTILDGFATGIFLLGCSKLIINSTNIQNCHVGIEAESGTIIESNDSQIFNSDKCAILLKTKSMDNHNDLKKVNCTDVNELTQYFCQSQPIKGDLKFERNSVGNIIVYNRGLMSLTSDMEESTDAEYVSHSLSRKFEKLNSTQETNGSNSSVVYLETSGDSVISLDD